MSLRVSGLRGHRSLSIKARPLWISPKNQAHATLWFALLVSMPKHIFGRGPEHYAVYDSHVRADDPLRTSRCGFFFPCHNIPSDKSPIEFVYDLLSNLGKYQKSVCQFFSRVLLLWSQTSDFHCHQQTLPHNPVSSNISVSF